MKKRIIAILLLVIFIALPLVTLAGETTYLCRSCGKHNATGHSRVRNTPWNANYHKTVQEIYTVCPDCHDLDIRATLWVGIGEHVPVHGTMNVGNRPVGCTFCQICGQVLSTD